MTEDLERMDAEIPKEWKKYKEENGWTWREVIGLGIKAKQGNPEIIKRITILEEEMKTQKEKAFRLQEKVDKALYQTQRPQ